MRILLRFIFSCFVISINLYPDDEEIQCTHLTAEDGLSLSVVTSVLQDSRGFLWFGTYNGLNRYDGYNFRIFMPEPSNPQSISNHSILDLFEDSKGVLWVGTSNGLNKFNWKTEKFFTYKNIPNDTNSLSNNTVRCIFEDRSGTLWIGTSRGLNKFNRNKNNFTPIRKIYEISNPDAPNSVTSIQEDEKGLLWLGSWNGLICMQKNGKIIQQFLPKENDPKSISSREITVIYIDKSGNLWIGTNGQGLNIYNPETGRFTRYSADPLNSNSISDNYISTIYQDQIGNIWIGTKEGLNKFDQKNNRFIRFFHDLAKPFTIGSNWVLSMIEDKTGLIWVGTLAGLSRFHLSTNKFNYYREEKNDNEKSLTADRVNSVFIDKENSIWVGTRNGLNQIKTGEDKIIHYHPNPADSRGLNNKYVMTVLADHSGIIWIGTDGGGLTRYNPLNGEFKVFKSKAGNDKTINNNGAISLCEDHNGGLWIGTWTGFCYFDTKKEAFKRYILKYPSSSSTQNNIIWAIFEDSRNMIWLGTDGGGAAELDPRTNTFKYFIPDSSGTGNISGSRVFSIFESDDKTMWFGTNNGLNSYDRVKGKFTSYATKDGLPSILINSIQEDRKGNLWISTDKGLSKFNRQKGTFRNYSKRDGLAGIEFSPNASFQSDTGILYFGSSDGLLYFNPDSIKDAQISAHIVFTDLKIYNQSVPISGEQGSILKESLNYSKNIHIPSGNDVITIEFALLDFFEPKRNKFSYKLAGFDPDWNDVGYRNSATYTNLPPGEYKFLLKASNNTISENAKAVELTIVIEPSFFQTIWFKIILSLGAIIVTFIIIQNRTYRIKKRNEILEKRIAERTQDLDRTIQELSQEISERKKAEAKVQTSLEEKEILLKEIHHRVKNNLQVISSLLYLNSKKIKDADVLNMFKDSQNRVKSIALVHERLYQSQNFGKINIKDYIQKLIQDLFRSY
ncbi:MAG TPA: two-component regulator propeller domain-containing protein, partial [Ignavibacteriaceae bacterium]|nr:two-component regulator propeller domain-containing protein [Ignavibacteriaceae bacterium]